MSQVYTPTPGTERTPGADGLTLFVRSWRPEGAPRGVVAIVHGFHSRSGHYTWGAEQLVTHDLAVYAVDLRGRGQSDGERFYVAKLGDYLSDVSALMGPGRSREPGLPVYLLGHGAGGVVSTVYALDRQRQLTGLVCESFAFPVPAPDFALAVIVSADRTLKLYEGRFHDLLNDVGPEAVMAGVTAWIAARLPTRPRR
jgi:acylglycerol lipase